MRLVAYITKPNGKFVRAMIYQSDDGAYLFLYSKSDDGPSDADQRFESVLDAQKEAFENYEIHWDSWNWIADPAEGRQHDWIRNTRIKRNEKGEPVHDQFEPLPVYSYHFSLSQSLSDSKLKTILASCVGCSTGDVRLIETLKNPEQFDGCAVLAQRWKTGGDFPLHLSFLRLSPEFSALTTDLVTQVCRLANCQALLSDETLNPYKWLVVDGVGNQVDVIVDPDALDDRDEFVIPESQQPTWLANVLHKH